MRPSTIPICLASITIFSIGRFLSKNGMLWYQTLTLPAITPPSWVFGVVWPMLFITITYAVISIWQNFPRIKAFYAITLLWVIHTIAHVLWSYTFFTQKNIGLALWVSIVLVATLGIIMCLIKGQSSKAIYLLLPYFFWLIFATYLNYQIILLNPGI